MEFFCEFSSVDQGEGFIKSLEEENPEFFEWVCKFLYFFMFNLDA